MRALASVASGALLAVGVLAPLPAPAAPAAAYSPVSVAASTTVAARTARIDKARLRIPALGVNAGVIPVGVTRSGELAIGTSVTNVYRWGRGVRPGQRGSAVLAGHTWSRGDGVFDRLGALRRGARVLVGVHVFRVTRVRKVRSLSRSEVQGLYSDRGRSRLVLITCGDRNNTTGVYRSRILVYAEKV